jgi:hypothetical protein
VTTSQATAAKLTPAQARALLACVAQDPKRYICGSTGRRMAVDCDGRSQGRLVELDLLGWAPGWENMNTVTDWGREVAGAL